MKKLLILSLTILLFSCKKEDKVEEEVAKIPVKFNVERFDKIFYESKPEDLSKIKSQYPFFFPEGNEDTVWANKLSNPLMRELYSEVQNKYSNVGPLESELTKLFGYAQYYFPEYERIGFEENQILPDLVNSFSFNKVAPPTNRSFLALMIYKGKQLYLKDKLLPDYSDAAKIAYTDSQIQWCKENEYQMWSYFIENNILFEANMKNEFRFINNAPFSKFYLGLDKESPGRVGQWLGWQIVRSYMENNDTSLKEMLALDAKTIFDKSKYKPAK